jgi:hypothetical protein
MRRIHRLLVAILIGSAIGFAILLPLFAILVTEGALHVWMHPTAQTQQADYVVRDAGSYWHEVQIQAADGVHLSAWLFNPARPNGGGVILLHGVGDTRMGMTSHAYFLLRAGYTVLLPDSRGHGASGGALISYGVREADDMHRWASLLLARPGITRLYGLGQSMGAAILIESLPREPRFRALVADCSFATFEEIAYERLEQRGLPFVAAWPVAQLGFIYSRVHYGIDLHQANPSAAIRATHIPVLLIHGVEDHNIPIRHSRELHAANPRTTQLWEVAGADHVASLSTAPAAYQEKVIAFFQQ